MGELAQEYEGRVEFNVISAEETAKAGKEIESFGFTDQRHGLVAFSSKGEALVKLPGHQFGKAEIKTAVETVLAAN